MIIIKEERAKINIEVKTIASGYIRFDNFNEIQIEGTFTAKELKDLAIFIKVAEDRNDLVNI